MGKIFWNITALMGLIAVSHTASAALDSRVAKVIGNSAYQNVSQLDDPKNHARWIVGISRDFSITANDRGAQLDLGKAGIGLLAQTGAPAAPATTQPSDSKAPQDQSSPAIALPPNPTSTMEVKKAEPSVPGCALRYMAAELAGKLKGRKWKEFHEQECGASNIQAVFPSAIAPKYSGEKPDKARTLTCADQFTANKATNANGGLKWIERSGGYYSECVIRLKG
jgi:hypothetical protein